MAKSGTQIKELQRRLVRLTRLDGRLIVGTDGAWLISAGQVRDPRPLVQALQAGSGLTAAILRAALELPHEPLLMTTRWLAAAQRDLINLQKDPDALAQIAAAARRFRSLPQPTAAWLAERQQRLNELAAELHEPAGLGAKSGAPTVRPALQAPPWFFAAGALVRTLRGPAEARALQQLWRSSVAAPSPAQTARRRFSGLLDRLAPRPDPRPEEPALQSFLDDAARDAKSLLGPDPPEGRQRAVGRAQLRRLNRLLRRVLAWPATPGEAHAPEIDSAALRSISSSRALLTELAAPLLASLPKSRDAQSRARLATAVAHYGLLFRIAPDCRPLNILDLDWLEQQLERATQLAEYGLTLMQALALLKHCAPETGFRVGQQERDLTQLARQVAAGVPLELLLRTCQLGYDAEVRQFTGAAPALRAYCEWVVRLAPLYQQSGRKLALAPAMLTRFAALREPSVAFFVHCLVGSATDAAPRSSEVALQLTMLDAAVGLCGRVPQRAAALVSALTTWPSGAGQAQFPEFAAWLGDDPLLDRYLHLATLAGEPAELSRTLLRDFAQAERLLRERRYLTSLTAPDAKQQQRLVAVEKSLSSAELPSAGWTRRRLAERVADLLGRALQRQLDIVLRDVLRQSFGVAPAVLTPAWRDAVRFYLSTEDNAELLGALLRFAAASPGGSPARVFAKNQPWLRRASHKIDLDAWLASRRTELELEGQRYTLALEDDPIEVLRMGIPFGTCLSLEDGCNAAAAVINALDANKRVLYLRDRRGVIVGRKLLAISSDWALLGYELYLSLDTRHRPAVAAAVLAFCEELARAVRLPLAPSGIPEALHDGFWYDDGTQPFAGPVEPDVAAYCQLLGQPVPTPRTPNLAEEAAQWRARKTGSVKQALGVLRPSRQWFSEQALGGWIIDHLGLAAAEQTARQHHNLRPFVLRRAASEGVQRLLQLAGSWEDGEAYEVQQILRLIPPSAQLCTSLIEAAERTFRRREHPDDHGLAHLTFTELEASLAVTPLAQILALCDRLQPLWDWFITEQTGCELCRASAEDAVLRAVRQQYFSRPDPDGVLAVLRSRRASRLAQRAALHVAAAFPLVAAPKLQLTLRFTATPLDQGSPEGLRAVQTLGTRHPDLAATPDFLAALLRQSPRPLRIELPTPKGDPFAELGDLLLDPATRAALAGPLAPLVSGPTDLTTYSPSAWELYYHRRQETPLRKRVARAVHTHSAQEAGENNTDTTTYPKLLSLLADLGDVKTLTALAAQFDKGSRGRHIRSAIERAHVVAQQIELDLQRPDAPLCTLGKTSGGDSVHTPRRPQLRDVPEILDQELLQRVLHKIEHTLRTAAPVDSDYVWALYALTTTWLTRPQTGHILQLLIQSRRGTFDAIELWYLDWFLLNNTTWDLPEISPELAVELWQQPELRSSLATALAKATQWSLRYQRMVQIAQRRGQSLDGLLQRWLPLQIASDVDTVVSVIGTAAELELLLDVAFTHLKPPEWLAIYQALAGYGETAGFLDKLRSTRLDPSELAQLKVLVDGASWHYPDDKARGSWLTAQLLERRVEL